MLNLAGWIDPLYVGIRAVHVPIALACVPAFWITLLSRKGGRLHVRTGRAFGWGMRFVALSGMVMGLLVLLDPALDGTWEQRSPNADRDAFDASRRMLGAFFLYLGTITFFPVHHGIGVLARGGRPSDPAGFLSRLFPWLPLVASVVALALGLASFRGGGLLLVAMSPLGIVESVLALSYRRSAPHALPARRLQHLTFMLIAGIAAHTAFAVFFLGSMLEVRLPGPWAALPWIAPTLVGIPAIVLGRRAEQGRSQRP